MKKRQLSKLVKTKAVLIAALVLSPSPVFGAEYSVANEVSSDGNVVVGYAGSDMSSARAFRWTESDGMEVLGTLKTGNQGDSWARGVNSDGSVVVGVAENDSDETRAFRWTESSGMKDLGTLKTDNKGRSLAHSVNRDGSVVVGVAENDSNENRAFRWKESSGMKDLGTFKTGNQGFSFAKGVNSDGSVVVGWAENDNSENRAFRWTENGGMKDLGTFKTGNQGHSSAKGVNSDGSVVVGEAQNDSDKSRAFRWTESGGMKDLGTLKKDNQGYSSAIGVNSDGSVVVGWADTDNTNIAFRWSEKDGMISVAQWLANNGVPDTEKLDLSAANGVDGAGNTIVGYGMVNGNFQAYVARNYGILGMTDFKKSILTLQNITNSLEYNLNNTMDKTFNLHNFGRDKFGLSIGGDWSNNDNKNIVIGAQSSNQKLIYGIGYAKHDGTTDLLLDGIAHTQGNTYGVFLNYGLPEGTGTQVRLSLAMDKGDTTINRDFMAGSQKMTAIGNPDYKQRGIIFEAGYGKMLSNTVLVTPYVGIVSTKTKIDSYTEIGGNTQSDMNVISNGSNFLAQLNSRENSNTYSRVGLKATTLLGSSNTKLNLGLSRMIHISGENDAITGQLTGVQGFSQPVVQGDSYNELYIGVDIKTKDDIKNPGMLKLGYSKRNGSNFNTDSSTYSLRYEFGF